MAATPHDPLESLLRTEAERLGTRALQEPRDISQDDMDGLGRLARLVEIRKSLRASPSASPWTRWTAPVVLVATLAVASLLLFTHVRQTEIELDVRVSELGLRPRADAVLLEEADLVRLGVAGAQAITVRPSADWPGLDVTSSEDGPLNLEIAADAPGISLSAIRGGEGTRAWIQPGKGPGQVRVSIEGDDIEIEAALLGPVRLAGAGLQPQTVEFRIPRPAVFRAKQSALDLDLTAADPASIVFSPQIGVGALSLYQVRQSENSPRRLSSLLSGSLYLGSLNGLEHKLRPGQELRLDGTQGEIRTIQLSPGSLGLQFHGYVDKLETGSYDNPRNLMPAWLEWLQARHGVSLLWGTGFYVFGIVSAALRWFNRPAAAG